MDYVSYRIFCRNVFFVVNSSLLLYYYRFVRHLAARKLLAGAK